MKGRDCTKNPKMFHTAFIPSMNLICSCVCVFFSCSASPQWVTLNGSWEFGFLRLRPAHHWAPPSAPATSELHHLALASPSVVLTAWTPRNWPAKCHITSGSALPGSGPPFSNTSLSPAPPLDTTCKGQILVCFCLFISPSLHRWEDDLSAVDT